MIRVVISLLLLFSNIFYCVAGTIDPYVDDQKYIDYAEKFHYIGEILVSKNDNIDLYSSGSVVAIDDKIVLTAAHILHEAKIAKILINKKALSITKSVSHHEYQYEIFGKHDIAVCFLDNTIGLEWYPSLYSESDEAGKICSLSGYGATGTFVTGVSSPSDGRKRAGSNIIDRTDGFVLFCSPSFVHQTTPLEFLIAVGDSGGGLFIENKLAGIHSGIIEDKANRAKSKYGAVSVHTRISTYKDWIKDIIIKNKDE